MNAFLNDFFFSFLFFLFFFFSLFCMPLIYFGQEPKRKNFFVFSNMMPNQEKKKLDTKEFFFAETTRNENFRRI